ncbi:hypothetical protein CYMTET_47615 [Cymbomonas tetramitiformis]|uniref:Uncharacterized protein n=1 Tax=Cymbomonas tetramitiformis TaxID=36881 RepID=A0AAE0BTW7_9CHLO|nr:hypothetical protein CYMTET_47615 [Cymbomonas tetramitiformis]
MVTTRSTSSAPLRRRNLATIFDQAAARHAATPGTPTATVPPASGPPAAFVAAVRTLIRTRHDEKAAKFVAKKCFGLKDERFHGNEKNVHVIFTRMVAALREAFVAEDEQLGDLFILDDAGITVREESNQLLFSTLELLVHPSSPASDWLESSAQTFPADGKRVLLEFARKLLHADAPFQGTSDLLAVELGYGMDPDDSIMDFNAALAAAKRKNTLDEDDVKGQFIQAMDADYYRPVVSRLLLHDQRAAVSLLTVQQWARECHAAHVRAGTASPKSTAVGSHMLPARFGDPPGGHTSADADVMEILLALRKEVRVLSDKVNGKGFTPRAEKPHNPRAGLKYRFAASPLPEGNYSQGNSKLVAFHRGTGQAIPLCQHSTCTSAQARHWHRDCPHGGPRAEKTAAGAHSFAVQEVEGDFYAAAFQHAIDNNDTGRFDALCFLAGGKPVMLEDLSAASFCVGDTVETHAIDEYLECCQPADTRIGVCAVGGAMHVNTFQVHDKIPDDALDMPPPPAPPAAPQSVVSDEGMYPVSALHAHEPDTSFMDRFAVRFELTDPNPPLAMHCMGPMAPVDSVSVTEGESEDDDEGDPPPRQALGCGRPPLGFGYSALMSLAVCLMLVICATAAPSNDCPAPTSSATGRVGNEVGGAGGLTPTAIPPDLYWQPEGWYHGWYRTTYGYGWTWLPGPPQPPEAAPIITAPPSPGGAPPSPDYEPPAWDGGDGDELSSSIQHRIEPVAPGVTACGDIGAPSILSVCSTDDSTNSGTSSPGRCDSGTGSPGRCGSG